MHVSQLKIKALALYSKYGCKNMSICLSCLSCNCVSLYISKENLEKLNTTVNNNLHEIQTESKQGQ